MGAGASSDKGSKSKVRRSRLSFFKQTSAQAAAGMLSETEAEAQMKKREAAIKVIVRAMRQWRARRNTQRRIDRMKVQRKADKARRQSAMFAEINKTQDDLESRRKARGNRQRAWNETAIEDKAKAVAGEKQKKEDEIKAEAEKVQAREDEMAPELEMLCEKEHSAFKAGQKSPHIVLISDNFPANKKFIKMTEVADAYEAAVKVDATDGHPVVVVRYDFEITSLELLGKIRDAIRTKHPDLLARTISMVITHEYGALLPLKYLPSTQVGILGGTWKDGEQIATECSSERIKECHAFWMTMTHFLSASDAMSSETLGATAGFEAHDELAEALAAMKDPAKLEEFKNSTVKSMDQIANGGKKEEGAAPKYDRSKSKINFFLGSPLGSDGDMTQGNKTMAALKYVFHGAYVNSPSDFTAAGRAEHMEVFHEDLYEKAKQLKYKMIRIDRFGYDPKE